MTQTTKPALIILLELEKAKKKCKLINLNSTAGPFGFFVSRVFLINLVNVRTKCCSF